MGSYVILLAVKSGVIFLILLIIAQHMMELHATSFCLDGIIL